MNPNVVTLEIRPGPGGEEAKLWADDLVRMYSKFALSRGWKVTPVDESVIKIAGPDSYASLKNEAGVHRVQRVPVTEKRGRIHTSTASVAVLAEIPELGYLSESLIQRILKTAHKYYIQQGFTSIKLSEK